MGILLTLVMSPDIFISVPDGLIEKEPDAFHTGESASTSLPPP